MLAWKKWGGGETPESSGMKGDHLIGKYYVLFDKHYKEELKELWRVEWRGGSGKEVSFNGRSTEMLRNGKPEIKRLLTCGKR